jgi:hypothetical protein
MKDGVKTYLKGIRYLFVDLINPPKNRLSFQRFVNALMRLAFSRKMINFMIIQATVSF